jgi:hypothetical protein
LPCFCLFAMGFFLVRLFRLFNYIQSHSK